MAAAGFYVIFLAGLSWRPVGLVLAGCASLPLLWSLMHDYQRRRILTLLDPTSDPLGVGYHIIQSVIARPRPISSRYSSSNAQLPIKPNSSENTAKMKSVDRSGMNSRCACVPLSQPLPASPPEPTAMTDWMM